MPTEQRKIVILGGGFGGIKAALELVANTNFRVTLISDSENFRYYPTLYHAATGGRLTASSIPLKKIFEHQPVRLIKGNVQKINRLKKEVVTADGRPYAYDDLIVALGVTTNYFGIKGLEKFAYGIKSVEEATRLHDHLHKTLLDEGKPDLNYVIVGGGPTGVELAGALPGYLKEIMRRHGIQKHSLHVDLVEAAPRLIARMPKSYSKAVARRLRRLGVKLYLNQQVSAETADKLELGEHSIASHTVVWTAGVANHPFLAANSFALDEHGKVAVDDYLQAEDNLYVIGDNAGTLYSGMAQTALYDAKFVSRNLKRLARGKSPKAYKPKKPVYITPVGPHWAAVLWGPVQTYGFIGWLLRAAADFSGYRDYEPWWKATHLLMDENLDGIETCPVCTKQKLS